MAEPDTHDPQESLEAIRQTIETIHPKRGPTDKRNHLSLVDIRHALQLSNIPRGCWEAVSALYNEHLRFRHLCKTEAEIAAGEEWLGYQRDWINSLMLISQSVDGRQSELMTRSIMADKMHEPKQPAASIGGNEKGTPQNQGGERRGLFSR